jgi:hypothetical protein
MSMVAFWNYAPIKFKAEETDPRVEQKKKYRGKYNRRALALCFAKSKMELLFPTESIRRLPGRPANSSYK